MLYFLHGLNGYPEEWSPLISFFTKRGYPCQAVDYMKDCDLRRVQLKEYVSKIASIVTEQDVVIGHSMGALLMLKIAEKINVKAGVGICPAPPKGYKHAQISPIRQVRYIPNILFHIPFKPSYKLYRELFVSNLDEMSARKQYKMLQKQSSLVTYEVIKGKIPVDVSRTSCPLLFIATKDDAAIPPKVVQSMAQSFHASYQLYPGDHYIFNHWEDMAQGIFQFLQEKGIK